MIGSEPVSTTRTRGGWFGRFTADDILLYVDIIGVDRTARDWRNEIIRRRLESKMKSARTNEWNFRQKNHSFRRCMSLHQRRGVLLSFVQWHNIIIVCSLIQNNRLSSFFSREIHQMSMEMNRFRIVDDVIIGIPMRVFGGCWVTRIRFRSILYGMLTSKSSDDYIRIGWFSVFIVGSNLNAVLSFVSNVIDDSLKPAGIHRAFQSIIDIDSVAKDLSMPVQRIRNPMKKEAPRIALGDMGTKRWGERCRCLDSRVTRIRRGKSLEAPIVNESWAMSW